MLADFETVDPSTFAGKVYDVAVVGSGPAGITLARRLAAKGWTVGLFEAGGIDPTTASQEIYEGEIVGQDYFPLDTARLRQFGGTSGHWTGLCAGLDARDFLPNPVNPQSGWPITKADLDPYAPETAVILDLPEEAGKRTHGSAPAILNGGDALEPFSYFQSAPTRFGTKYRNEIETSPTIHLFLNANLVDLKLSDNLGAVSSALFRGYEKQGSIEVKARYFALCLGGIENPRFLLNCTSQIPAGIGNDNGLVGRFFCEHPHINLAVIHDPQVTGDLDYASTDALMASKKTLAFALRASVPNEGFFKATIRKTFCDREFLLSAFQSLSGKPMNCTIVTPIVRISAEQALNPDSTVSLSDQTDRFGKRRVKLDWRLSEVDFHTMRAAAVEIGRIFALQNVGRIKIEDWLLQTPPQYPVLDGSQDVAGFHHMCTTRMSADPKTGVVNADCRVHGVDNLYIGGSSVFSTAGHANPTYSIVQLALRLGDHLDTRLKS